VLTISGGKLASVSANLSDVSAFDAYFSFKSTVGPLRAPSATLPRCHLPRRGCI
jgi:hypothetical protein